ncbi:Uncharacterized protein Fot_55948 [Forsythia ovata]|uniref:Uncharacterized protein n=1 Tax=Forsythia ovata TaxID=205694 RepID=A0ABD1P2K3_9LAMI
MAGRGGVQQLRSGVSGKMNAVVGPETQELLRPETRVIGHGEGSGVSGLMGGGSGVKWLGWENLGHQNLGNLGRVKAGEVSGGIGVCFCFFFGYVAPCHVFHWI